MLSNNGAQHQKGVQPHPFLPSMGRKVAVIEASTWPITFPLSPLPPCPSTYFSGKSLTVIPSLHYAESMAALSARGTTVTGRPD